MQLENKKCMQTLQSFTVSWNKQGFTAGPLDEMDINLSLHNQTEPGLSETCNDSLLN